MDTLFRPIDRLSLCHRPHASIWLFSLVWGSYLILVQIVAVQGAVSAQSSLDGHLCDHQLSKGNHVFSFPCHVIF